MSHQLPSVTPREVIHALERGGFVVQRQQGSHAQLKHVNNATRRATVPIHPGSIKKGTLHGILKQSKLSTEEFLTLL
jgi:predicted RNA binding protein YcfA (HicA-like mRNA interferase family)